MVSSKAVSSEILRALKFGSFSQRTVSRLVDEEVDGVLIEQNAFESLHVIAWFLGRPTTVRRVWWEGWRV